MRKSIFMILLGLFLAVPAFAVNKAPMKELIVASDGEFTTISAALASLPTPNTTPTIIRVMPGTYNEGSLTMKSNVHLQGSGRDITTIDTLEGYIDVSTLNNVTISNLTIYGYTPVRCWNGCDNLDVSRNKLIKSGAGGGAEGIALYDGVAGTTQAISDNIITGGFAQGIDIYYCNSSVTVRNNIIKGNASGLYIANSNPLVMGNEISGNTINGIYAYGPGNIGKVVNNVITNSTQPDIAATGLLSISQNVYDTFSGSGAVGMYNVKQDGTPAPLQ